MRDLRRVLLGLAALFIFSAFGNYFCPVRQSVSAENKVAAPPAPTAEATPAPAPAPAPATPSPCLQAVPIIRRECQMSALKLEKCQVAQKSQTSLDIQKLGRGILINISVPGPEWYLLDGGGLVAINGLAAGACKELPDYHEMLQRKEG